eukprot:gb/GFBE01029776.1/.p1 GENE.gb/GFBE01029776.1/~~gb/GFBE01029776.1/.p1  ORF type:complete len:159 (+),score=21.35 gb/GFBE01029776.1/:1-477(+)
MARRAASARSGLLIIACICACWLESPADFMIAGTRRASLLAVSCMGFPQAAQAAEMIPKGKYCGKALGLNMVLNFSDGSHVDFSMNPYTGSPRSCTQLSYTYDSASNKIRIATNECWELAWRSQSVNPSYGEVAFAYRPQENTVEFIERSVSSFLNPC